MTQSRGGFLSPKSKVSLGLVGGFAASIVMGFSFVALSVLGVMQFDWLPTVGQLFGGSRIATQAAFYGLLEYVILGMVWGLIFAFAFKSYSVMKGMGIGGIAFAIMVIALASVSTAGLQGKLFSLSLTNDVLVVVSLAIGYACWGFTLGYIGKRYAE